MGFLKSITNRVLGKRPMREVVNSGEYKERFVRRLDAKYDAAGLSRATETYWLNSDHLSPNASLDPQVRRRIRSRARYELENNSFARSMALGLSAHMIGTGPRRQMLTKSSASNNEIEAAWLNWSEKTCFASKMRTMRKARVTDGSGFGQMMTNRRLRHDVMLDIQLIEDDQIASPTFDHSNDTLDGIKYDKFGNAISYEKLRAHPGANTWHGNDSFLKSDTIPAEFMLHSYRVERPGQVRGISELASVLPLFAMLRRYQMATLTAAETAADFAAIMYSDLPVGSYEAPKLEDDWGAAVPIDFGSMVTLPAGWKAGQLKAEHPTSTFEMFNRAIKAEIARALLMPYNVAAADSSQHNFSSGRLDMLLYIRFLETERIDFEHQVLNLLFDSWLAEYLATRSGVRASDVDLSSYRGRWQWDAAEFELDPAKAAKAEQARLFTTRSLQGTLNSSGLDYQQTVKENADALGMSVPEYQSALRDKFFGGSQESSPLTPDDVDDQVVDIMETGAAV